MPNTLSMDLRHDGLQASVDFSSRDQLIRMEFWLCSKPLTATSPALEAFPGAWSTPRAASRCTAPAVRGMLAPSMTAMTPLPGSDFASSSSPSPW